MAVAIKSIMDLIEARLDLITTTNEYAYDITNIKRAMMKPWKAEDLPAVNYWSTGLINEANEYGKDQRDLPVFIEAHTKTYDENFMDVASKLAADIVTALNRAPAAPKVSDVESYNLGETVSDLIFEGYDHEIGEGQEPWCGVLVKIIVRYTTEIFDMASFGA